MGARLGNVGGRAGPGPGAAGPLSNSATSAVRGEPAVRKSFASPATATVFEFQL